MNLRQESENTLNNTETKFLVHFVFDEIDFDKSITLVVLLEMSSILRTNGEIVNARKTFSFKKCKKCDCKNIVTTTFHQFSTSIELKVKYS